MNFKKGDKVIHLATGKIYIIKYMIGNKPIINDGGNLDFPAHPDLFVPHSPLMEELL